MNTQFFASRAAARNAVAFDGKFQDMGKDAEAGKRWAVVNLTECSAQHLSRGIQLGNHTASDWIQFSLSCRLEAELPTAEVMTEAEFGATESKKAIALRVIAELDASAQVLGAARAKRSYVITELVSKHGMTKAGAGTYYFNVRSGKWV